MVTIVARDRSVLLCFFFKHKTAYEMRISDWSSDVCSSDLPDDPALQELHQLLWHGRDDRAYRQLPAPRQPGTGGAQADPLPAWPGGRRQVVAGRTAEGVDGGAPHLCAEGGEIGRAHV